MSKSEDPLYDSMTVVKTGTCDTITKKSRLTYQIGTLPDGEVYLRIHKTPATVSSHRNGSRWLTYGRCFPKYLSASRSPRSC